MKAAPVPVGGAAKEGSVGARGIGDGDDGGERKRGGCGDRLSRWGAQFGVNLVGVAISNYLVSHGGNAIFIYWSNQTTVHPEM